MLKKLAKITNNKLYFREFGNHLAYQVNILILNIKLTFFIKEASGKHTAKYKLTDFKRKYFTRNNFFYNWAANAVELAVEAVI
jgi:hypothetical protein